MDDNLWRKSKKTIITKVKSYLWAGTSGRLREKGNTLRVWRWHTTEAIEVSGTYHEDNGLVEEFQSSKSDWPVTFQKDSEHMAVDAGRPPSMPWLQQVVWMDDSVCGLDWGLYLLSLPVIPAEA